MQDMVCSNVKQHTLEGGQVAGQVERDIMDNTIKDGDT